MLSVILLVVVVGTAIWVAVDASNLGVKKGCLGGGFVDSGPVAWFFATLLLWIVAFPLYLATRPKYVALHGKATGAAMAAGHAPVLPPPGWNPDPNVAGAMRWWDGQAWGPSAPPSGTGPA